MKLIFPPVSFRFMEDEVLAGDVDVGDVIVLPDAEDPVLVCRVRLGQGVLSSRSRRPAVTQPTKKSGL